MKVLFINTNQERLPDPIPPIGVTYVAAVAKQDGHECKLFDFNFHNKDFAAALKEFIKEFSPQVIGLSIRNVDNVAYPKVVTYVDGYQEIVKVCREEAPEVPIIVGGSAFSLFPEEFMLKLNADYGVVGEGEEIFREILRSLEKGEVPKNPNPGLSNTPNIHYPTYLSRNFGEIYPAREIMDVSTYFKEGGSINIQTKRGCSLRCSYCNYPLLEGIQVRKRAPSDVVDEMEYCFKEYGVDYFFFVDNVFNLPNSHAKEICQKILERKLKVKWTAYVSPAKVSENLFATFKEAGCSSVDFGVDAASNIGLSSMDKIFTVKEIKNSAKWCHQYGIKFNHSLILGVPGETIESIEETIENIMACKPTSVTALIGVRIYKGTPIAIQLIKEGWIKEEQICIKPVFYVEESVREYLLNRLANLSTEHRNWIVPGLKKNMNERYFKRVRLRGVKGPLWEAFA